MISPVFICFWYQEKITYVVQNWLPRPAAYRLKQNVLSDDAWSNRFYHHAEVWHNNNRLQACFPCATKVAPILSSVKHSKATGSAQASTPSFVLSYPLLLSAVLCSCLSILLYLTALGYMFSCSMSCECTYWWNVQWTLRFWCWQIHCVSW